MVLSGGTILDRKADVYWRIGMRAKGFFMRTVVAGATALAIMAFASPAKASAVIDFSGVGFGGPFILLAGGNASGSNIPITTAFYLNTPNLSGDVDIVTSGRLDFNTVTNTLTIHGGIPELGIADGSLLLSGTFGGWMADANGLQGAFGFDVKSRELLIALGLPADTPFEFFGFTIVLGDCVDQVCAYSTDIRNTSIPEPGSMLLLGTGLVGLGGVIRRRFKK